MSSSQLQETLKAVLNDNREIADVLNRALFPDTKILEEQRRQDIQKLHV